MAPWITWEFFGHNWLIYVVPISAQMLLCKSGSQSYIESSGGLVKNKNCWPTPQIFDLVGLAWGLRICISNKIPGKVNAVDQGTTLGNHCCKATHLTEEGPGNLRFWPRASAWEAQSFEYQGGSLSLFMCSLSTHLSDCFWNAVFRCNWGRGVEVKNGQSLLPIRRSGCPLEHIREHFLLIKNSMSWTRILN